MLLEETRFSANIRLKANIVCSKSHQSAVQQLRQQLLRLNTLRVGPQWRNSLRIADGVE